MYISILVTPFKGSVNDNIMNNQSKRCLEKQGNNNNTKAKTTQLARNSHFSKKNWLPRVELEPTTISLLGDALTN